VIEYIGVPYEIRTRVAAVEEKQFTVIQRNSAAWIALYRTLRTHGNAYWTRNGRARCSRRDEGVGNCNRAAPLSMPL
jgi:hypothetical protein